MKRLKKIITVTIAMVMLFTMIGCGNTQATTSTPSTSEVTKSANKPTEQAKPTQPVTKEAETKKVEPTTVAHTSAPTKAPEVTTEDDKGNVPLNLKISSSKKVLAYPESIDFEGFYDVSGVDATAEDINIVTNFVKNNKVINVPYGSKVILEDLIGFSELSRDLQWGMHELMRTECCKSDDFINNDKDFKFTFILYERKGYKTLELYRKD